MQGGAAVANTLIYKHNLTLAMLQALWHKDLSKRRDDLDLRCLGNEATQVQTLLSPTLENNMAEDLTKKLESIILDLKKLMKERKDRIEELRAEIEEIEASNESLEKEIQSMLSYFQEDSMKRTNRGTTAFETVLMIATVLAGIALMLHHFTTFN